ncbi:MAG: helix-turn-helix domain-containing protein [Dehalococcoidia bacterium]
MTRVTQAHVEARTQDILASALDMFARKGVDQTTMQDIATEAGISAGAIYRYFPSKDDLLRAVLVGCAEDNQRVFEGVASEETSPIRALCAVGRKAWSWLKEEGAREQTIMNLEMSLAAARRPDELGPEQRRMVADTLGFIEQLVLQAQATGELDTSLDARALAQTLLASHVGTKVLALEISDIDTDAVFGVVEEILHRLAPRVAAGREAY